jgi:toxin ParE1/3/4
MAYDVVFTRRARDDLIGLYDYIAARSGPERATGYIDRIADYCRGFAEFPERGTRRDDLIPGLRIVGFEPRLTIAFHIDQHRVVFDRILYGGRDLDDRLEDR